MSDHDPLCPATIADGRWRARCECDLIARVRAEYTDWVAPGQHDAVVATAEARVRADERAVAQVQACDAHISQVRWAEAVAARLVEVIVRQEQAIHALSGEADYVKRCDETARRGTGMGVCDTLLDEHGNCPNARGHLS